MANITACEGISGRGRTAYTGVDALLAAWPARMMRYLHDAAPSDGPMLHYGDGLPSRRTLHRTGARWQAPHHLMQPKDDLPMRLKRIAL